MPRRARRRKKSVDSSPTPRDPAKPKLDVELEPLPIDGNENNNNNNIKFQVDEELLAFDLNSYWAAKCLNIKRDKATREIWYRIHFIGWAKRHDVWRLADTLKKKSDDSSDLSDCSQDKEEEEKKHHSNTKKKKKGKKSQNSHKKKKRVANDPLPGAPPRKRVRLTTSTDIVESPAFRCNTSTPITIFLPDRIKELITLDWRKITVDKCTVPIPRPIGYRIVDIIDEYLDKIRDDPSKDMKSDIAKGLMGYFEECLETCLLYRFERPQLEEMKRIHKTKPKSHIYGAEHFIRLFAQLPKMIDPNDFNLQDRYYFDVCVSEIISLISRKWSKLFLADRKNSRPYNKYENRGKDEEYLKHLKSIDEKFEVNSK